VTRTNPELPAELEGVIGKAFEKVREKRFASAAEIRDKLQNLRRQRLIVIWQAESLSKFNSCLGIYRLRQLNAIWAASRTSNTP